MSEDSLKIKDVQKDKIMTAVIIARVPQTYKDYIIKHNISPSKLMRKSIETLMKEGVMK